jgi:putative membrane protein
VTLLLVTFRGYRRGLTRMLHSRTVHIAAHPLVGFILSIGAMYVLYLTPLYSATLRHPLLHEAIHAHFVLVGCLFAWAVVGVDSIPRRASLTTRGAVLLTALAAHAILAKLLYALGPSAASLPADATAEWKDGAQLMWYAGDAVELVFVTAFFAQWYLRGGRRLARVRDQAVLDSASAIGN